MPKNNGKNIVKKVLIALLVIGLLVAVALVVKGCQQDRTVSDQDQDRVVEVIDPTPVPGIRIPGRGSQLDHSEGLPFARVNVHDDEPANSAGYFDRSIVNTDDPADIGMDDSFTIPDDWTVERDYSLANNRFVEYMTIKPPVSTNAEEIRNWAADNGFSEGISYEITSVILFDGQECTISGLDANRVRTNVYVGENWSYQPCTFE